MGSCPDVLFELLSLDLEPYIVSRDDRLCTPRQFACQSLKRSLLKKFQATAQEPAMLRVATEKFHAANQRCGTWSYSPETLHDELLLGTFRERFYRWCLSFESDQDLDTLLARGRPGPGANRHAVGCDFYTKHFSSPLSASTPGLYEHYTRSINIDPRWREAERLRYSRFGSVRICDSAVTFVAKNREESRTICTEPSLNMFYQQGLGSLMERALLREFHLDLSQQQLWNRELARVGSIDGSFATIDLSSASDTISCRLVEWCSTRQLLHLINFLRCRHTQLSGQRIGLNMVSTMGNAFTFPLQTAIFACAVSAVYDLRGRRLRAGHVGRDPDVSYGVNGDDIVVRKDCYAATVRLLTLLGFTVNQQKSFSEGYFRESCGGDYFHGHHVRGVYVKSLASVQDNCNALNRLVRWSARHEVPLPRVTSYLLRFCGPFRVPRWEGDDAGVHVPSALVSSQSVTDSGLVIYQFWEPRGPQMRLKTDRVVVPKSSDRRLRAVMHNPEGIGLAVLQGAVRRDRVAIRLKQGEKPRYVRSTGVAPYWDYIGDRQRVELTVDGWRTWDSYVMAYFTQG